MLINPPLSVFDKRKHAPLSVLFTGARAPLSKKIIGVRTRFIFFCAFDNAYFIALFEIQRYHIRLY